MSKRRAEALPERHDGQIASRVATGAGLLFGNRLLQRLLGLLNVAIIARLLLPADYGIVALATTVISFIFIISELRMGGLLIATKTLGREEVDTAFTLSLIRGVLITSSLLLFAEPLARFMQEPRLVDVLRWLAIIPILDGLRNPNMIYYERNIDFRRDFGRSAAGAIVGSVVAIAAAFYFRSYWALIVSQIAVSFTHCAMSYWRIPVTPGLSLARWREMFQFGGWLTLGGIVDYVTYNIDYFLIGRQLGSTQLGIYNVGQRVTLLATGELAGPLSRAVFPAFSMMTEDLPRLRAGYRQAQTVIIGLALPMGIGAALIAREIIVLTVGARWLEAAIIVQLLAPIIVLQNTTGSVTGLAMALGRTRSLFVRSLVMFAARVPVLIAGFLLYGFLGVIYARVISGSIHLLYGMGLAGRLTQDTLWAPFIVSWRSFVSVAAMTAALLLLPRGEPGDMATGAVLAQTAMLVTVGAIVYAAVHTALWALSGRPAGFEQRMLRIVRDTLGRLRRRLLPVA